MRARLTAVAAGVAMVVASCGGGHDISADGSDRLGAVVADLRVAAASRDAARVQADVQQVKDIVGALQGEGDISDERAAKVMAAVAEVEGSVRLITTTTTAPTPVFAPWGKAKKSKHEKDD